jgi:hypothetical protein
MNKDMDQNFLGKHAKIFISLIFIFIFENLLIESIKIPIKFIPRIGFNSR